MLLAWILLILCNCCFGFVMLYPFYLRDKHPSRYRGIWLGLGDFLRDRHGSIWLMVILAGGTLFNIAAHYVKSPFAYFLLMPAYFLFSGMLLLYPYHLKYHFPKRYRGFWKVLGDWMGEPLIAFSKRRN